MFSCQKPRVNGAIGPFRSLAHVHVYLEQATTKALPVFEKQLTLYLIGNPEHQIIIIVIVNVISQFLERHLKTKRTNAPAYS